MECITPSNSPSLLDKQVTSSVNLLTIFLNDFAITDPSLELFPVN